uniref:DDB1- and CUL4-associated factor 1 n=1 Tax=Clastoptera arizonana TaxID=38151 RepID=A0A1B6BYB4_9HEMI
MQGLQHLLEVPRPSIAATGVSLCLYYIAYCEDAMERVCLLPQNILSDLVKYALWLLECAHDSGRCNATMFFGLSFQFRVILEEFDLQDGLRKLYNVMSTLPILSTEDYTMNEDEEGSARQIVRHVCVALKKYLEAHLYIKAEQLRRAHLRESGGETPKYRSTIASYKACKSSPEDIQEQINVLLEFMPFRSWWAPVDDLTDLGGIKLLLQVIAFAYEWNYSGRAETVRSVLDVLMICAVMPRVQMLLCERVDLPDETMTVGMNVILGAAEGEIVADPDVQRSALGALVTCICAPTQRANGPIARFCSGSVKKKTPIMRGSEEVIEKLWDCVRSNNGIMVLLGLMSVKTPIIDADSIRALACKVLAGLARSETVRQIISKLPLFSNGQIQSLMRDPILQDKRQEHVRFQKHALELLERVSGNSNPNDNGLEVSLANIHKANVIAQTHIQFNERQLLQLIQQHLLTSGMTETAAVLQREASLPPIKPQPHTPIPSPFLHQRAITPGKVRTPLITDPHINQRSINTQQSMSDIASPSNGPLTANFTAKGGSTTANCITPIRLSLTNNRKTDVKYSTHVPSKSLEKPISYNPVQHQRAKPLLKECHVTLESIITEYLTNQHALCKNPMATCPQFNLFVPHKCPDPKPKNITMGNFVTRFTRGYRLKKLDRHLVHSRFYPVRTFRLGEDDGFFTCCEFLNDKALLVGTHQGCVKMFNIQTGAEENTFQCHDTYISALEASRDSKLLLSSSTWRTPLSALWRIGTLLEMQIAMDNEEQVEFSKLNQDKIIGTKGDVATIYDITTGQPIITLTPTLSNAYSKNRATFCPTDELVLSDGVLWDVNSGKAIHKFDKLNQALSGVFHPNGLEVISNTAVWDLRTFHLLRTVPLLDMCDVKFSSSGEVIYSLALEKDTMDDEIPQETSFKTLDAFDYSSIATIDVKKNIYDLACNNYDTQIATVENQGMFENVQESIVRLYDVGRRRDDEDEGEEEEDDEDLDASDDGSNSHSSDNNDGSNSPSSDNNDVGSLARRANRLLGDLINNINNEDDDEDVAEGNVEENNDEDFLPEQVSDSSDEFSSAFGSDGSEV